VRNKMRAFLKKD